jgi:type IV pilus assembly protein PilV
MKHSMRMHGFSLLEVMVALIIISIGMLGIAKMQGLALSSTTASRSRALAAIEASSLAAAMQANRVYWSNSASTPGAITITTSAGTPTFASTNGPMATAIGNAGGTTCSGMGSAKVSCLCTTSCSTVALAGADLYDFGWSLATFLPSSTTNISCVETDTPVDCTIDITWNENTVALTSQEQAQSVAAGSTVPVKFDLYVVP